MPMSSQVDGQIAVRPRDPESRALITGREPIPFPLGNDLIREIHQRYDFAITHESNAINRFASELGLDIRDVLDEYLGDQEFGRLRVERFLTNTGIRPLFSPVVEDGLRLGMERVAPAWRNLIARDIPVDSMTYEYYEFDNSDTSQYTLRRIGQGIPIPVARVVLSGKSYNLFKQGRGIEWTDEAKLAPIDLAALWFLQVGLQLGWDYHAQIIDMLLNGYFPDGTDDAPTVAANPAHPGDFDLADLLTAVGTMVTTYGYTPTVMLMSLTRAVATQTMENGAGYPMFPAGVEAAGLPPIQIANGIPDDKIIFVDTAFAMMRLVLKEFGTEFDRDAKSQVEGSYGTSVELTVPLFKNARLILDT